jgi:multiple sugar transport system ATP-binding protein
MNFFPAGLVNQGDARTIGVRPEDLYLTETAGLEAKVTHVEHLGGDTNVVAHVNEHQITARLFGQHDIEPGQDVHLAFEAKSAYHFDADGARLH